MRRRSSAGPWHCCQEAPRWRRARRSGVHRRCSSRSKSRRRVRVPARSRVTESCGSASICLSSWCRGSKHSRQQQPSSRRACCWSHPMRCCWKCVPASPCSVGWMHCARGSTPSCAPSPCRPRKPVPRTAPASPWHPRLSRRRCWHVPAIPAPSIALTCTARSVRCRWRCCAGTSTTSRASARWACARWARCCACRALRSRAVSGSRCWASLDRLTGVRAAEPRAPFVVRERFRLARDTPYELGEHAALMRVLRPMLDELEAFSHHAATRCHGPRAAARAPWRQNQSLPRAARIAREAGRASRGIVRRIPRTPAAAGAGARLRAAFG